MPAATSKIAPAGKHRRLSCWLLAVAIAVQAIWLPFHLASERHLLPGLDAAGTVPLGSGADDLDRLVGATVDDTDAPGEPPHSVLDHQSQKHLRHDDADEESGAAVGGDDDRRDDTPAMAILVDAALQLPIGRAPPRRPCCVARFQPCSPLLADAQPRAPPRG